MGTCRAALMHGMEGGARRGGVGDVRYGIWVRARVEGMADPGRTAPGARDARVGGELGRAPRAAPGSSPGQIGVRMVPIPRRSSEKNIDA